MKSLNFSGDYSSENKDPSREKNENRSLLPPKKRKYRGFKLDDDEEVVSELNLMNRTIKSPSIPNPGAEKIHAVDRERMLKIARIYRMIYDHFSDEIKNRPESSANGRCNKRPHIRAGEIVRNKFGKCLPTIGAISGVDIGDKFNNRAELSLIGLHLPLQYGVGSSFSLNNPNNSMICISVVATENYYENNLQDPNYLVYSGHGGITKSKKECEDQILKRGNLALMNSKTEKNEVRVICGKREHGKQVYTYYGLYLVENSYEVRGKCGHLIFKFGLRRITGQPNLPNGL